MQVAVKGAVRFFLSLALSAGAVSLLTPQGGDSVKAAVGRQPVLVELFTSEGCSSCPAADRLVINLQSGAAGRDVIVLSEHVDYWNYLGWEDHFSSAVFTNRQRVYAQVLGHAVFTPEAIIDGTYSVFGSEANALASAINRSAVASKASLSLNTQNDSNDSTKRKVTITVECPSYLPGKQAQLYLALTEDNLKTSVSSGENGGAVLEHTGVVRQLEKVSSVVALEPNKKTAYETKIKLDARWKKNDLRLVAFLQDPVTQAIRGAQQIRLK